MITGRGLVSRVCGRTVDVQSPRINTPQRNVKIVKKFKLNANARKLC